MPSHYVSKLAKQKDMTTAEAERRWNKAKGIAAKEGKAEDYGYITGIFQKMMGVSEMKAFKFKTLAECLEWYDYFLERDGNRSLAAKRASGMVRGSTISHKDMWGLVSELLDLKLLEDDGAPTNTTGEVVPDTDHVGRKGDVLRRKKKKCKKTVDESEKSGSMVSEVRQRSRYKMKAAERNKIARKIANWIRGDNVYQARPLVAFDKADEILREHGYRLVQEDGTDWSGMLVGREGRMTVAVAPVDAEDDPANAVDNVLVFEWYKLRTSYEVNMYLS